MKSIVVAALACIIVVAALPAQNVSPEQLVQGGIRLFVFPIDDPVAPDTINLLIEEGFVPVGLEVDADGSATMLLLRDAAQEIETWHIRSYTDPDTMENEISAAIQLGWTPMDISRVAAGLVVLFVERGEQVDSWRLHTEPDSADHRTASIQSFADQGFSLAGFSTSEGRAWMLFLREGSADEPAIGTISAYDKNTTDLRDGLAQAIAFGWIPIALGASESSLLVGYARSR